LLDTISKVYRQIFVHKFDQWSHLKHRSVVCTNFRHLDPTHQVCERHFKLLTLSINFLRAQKLTPTALNELGEVERATRIAQLFALGLFVKNQQTHEPRPTTVQHQSRARQCYINLTFTHQTKRILSALISKLTQTLSRCAYAWKAIRRVSVLYYMLGVKCDQDWLGFFNQTAAHTGQKVQKMCVYLGVECICSREVKPPNHLHALSLLYANYFSPHEIVSHLD
jgi:hypothetical protein